MAGRLAPFIELGVGFNMELTARENVQLNGVMMGLSRREAASRLDAVLEFAELEDFVDLKLKNYSSGMLVRLGFSGMIQADADILLIDEVLAVGDASFQQKCADVFHELRGSGKTLVLVTHDMAAVDSYCDRAILIASGKIVHEGDPHQVGRHYLRLNFDQPGGGAVAGEPGGSGVKIVDVWLEDALGRRTTNVELGEDINLRLVVEAEQGDRAADLLLSADQRGRDPGFRRRQQALARRRRGGLDRGGGAGDGQGPARQPARLGPLLCRRRCQPRAQCDRQRRLGFEGTRLRDLRDRAPNRADRPQERVLGEGGADVSAAAGQNPELRDVRGPSALGGGRQRFLDLLLLISVTDFKKTYYGTVLGYFWSLLRPAILFGVLLLVFTQVFKLKGLEIEHYPELLLLGIVLYTFFQESTTAAVTSVVANEGIVRKTQFPRLVIPLATVVTGSFNLLLNLIPVFIFILALGVSPHWTWLLLPVLLLILFVLATAVAAILSALYVRYRDVAIIWGVAGTVLLYGTPILYPINQVPQAMQTALLFNPLTPIFSQARKWIIEPDAPSAVAAMGGWGRFSISVAVFLVICVAAAGIFNREAPRIAEEL